MECGHVVFHSEIEDVIGEIKTLFNQKGFYYLKSALLY